MHPEGGYPEGVITPRPDPCGPRPAQLETNRPGDSVGRLRNRHQEHRARRDGPTDEHGQQHSGSFRPRRGDTPPEAATAETRRMLERWGTLHAGRSALGLVATLIFLWAQR
jgi:hypothetical protein